MSEQEHQEFTIPDDILTNPELIGKFLKMFESRLASEEDMLNKINNAKETTQNRINDLTQKKELLEKYNTFLHCKGFAKVKQEVDEHAEEINEAQKERMSDFANTFYNNDFINPHKADVFSKAYGAEFTDNNPPPDEEKYDWRGFCFRDYLKNGVSFKCTKREGHEGECG